MLQFFLYMIAAVVFSALANSYLYIKGTGLFFALASLLLLCFNLFCGLFSLRSKSRRRRVLHHGTMLLSSFYVSLIVSSVYHGLLLAKVIPAEKNAVIGSIVFTVITLFVTFWNGILCVYLTSVQLGIKLRVIGALCGLIPVVNLVVLTFIIREAYAEVAFETKKERMNEKRAGDTVCRTKYPILLVHGVFFRDFKHLNYWGRIPAELERNGAVCHYGNHSSAASVKHSGEELAERIREIIKETGCEKVNIIAHSKGGLDCRYAISACGIAENVASLTTVNTPHRGCLFADWLLSKAPQSLKDSLAAGYNRAAKLLGDEAPDFLTAVSDLTADRCRVFDDNTPTPDGIYTRSIGSVMNGALSGQFPLNLSHDFVRHFDGQNDGLVGVDSFAFGENYTLLDLHLKRGISHGDMIDLNRKNLRGFDVREFYVDLVSDLRQRGL